MGVLPSLLSLLLVAAAGAVRAAAAVGVNEAYYSSVSELKAYWQTALPNSPMPSAILEHLSAHADGEKVTLQQDALTFQWGQHKKGDVSTFQRGPSNVKGDQKVTFRWGPQKELADEKVTFRWGPDMKEDDEKVTLRWGQRKVGDEKITFQWGPQKEADDGKVTFPKGTHIKDDDKKHIVGRSPKRELADEKTTYRWDPNIKEDDEKVSLQWGQHNVVDEKVTFRWGPNMKEDYDKVTLKWCQHKVGDEKVTFWWGPNMKEDDEKAILRWGEHKVGDEKATFRWGSNMKEDDDKVTFGWGSHKREDGGNTEKFPSFHKDPYVKEKHHQVHGADHTHGQFNLANLLFSESVLAPGTVVTPYIEPSVMPTPFLRRDVAGSIPMSTKNFTNILSMFAPMSLAMAGKIWSTLHTCEHPHPLDSEQQACATSIESMVELAASVLGTRDIRAFSSSLDVPAEGVAPPSSRHVVAAVQAVTGPGEEATTMTCHGATFPYAVFYCHAVNPTRVYEVTLRKTEEDGTAAAAGPDATTMLVLAVCHLDTSQFDPENPFFVERGLKPGDASVCHFLSRDSVLWAPAASTQGYEQVVAQ